MAVKARDSRTVVRGWWSTVEIPERSCGNGGHQPRFPHGPEFGPSHPNRWPPACPHRYHSPTPTIPARRPVPLQGTRLRGFQNQADAIDAALELAAREGIGAVTFARVARDTGRSKSAVFEQFGSVERLRSRVLRRAAE